jgi:predicted ester cyclase
MSTTTQPSVIARSWFDAMNAGDLARCDELFSPTYQMHFPGIPEGARGPEVIRGVVTGYRSAFPDLRFTLENVVAEGDMVLVHWWVEGTNLGSLMGAPPTGKHVRWTGMSLLRIENGKITEDWVENDRLGMLQQLGLAPEPASV